MIVLDLAFWKWTLLGVLLVNMVNLIVVFIIGCCRACSDAEWVESTTYLPQCSHCKHTGHHFNKLCGTKYSAQVSVQKKRIVTKSVARPIEYEGGYVWKQRETGKYDTRTVTKTRQVPYTRIVKKRIEIPQEKVERIEYQVRKTRNISYGSTEPYWAMEWVGKNYVSVKKERVCMKWREEPYFETEYRTERKWAPSRYEDQEVEETYYEDEQYQVEEKIPKFESVRVWDPKANPRPVQYDEVESTENYYEKQLQPNTTCICYACRCPYCYYHRKSNWPEPYKCISRYMFPKRYLVYWLASCAILFAILFTTFGALALSKNLTKFRDHWDTSFAPKHLLPISFPILTLILMALSLPLYHKRDNHHPRGKVIRYGLYLLFVAAQIASWVLLSLSKNYPKGNIQTGLLCINAASLLLAFAFFIIEICLNVIHHRSWPTCWAMPKL
jgi:hypothetical protein